MPFGELSGTVAVLVAAIGALPGVAAAVLAYLNRRQLATPSGDTLGAVAERTHDITHLTNVHVRDADENARAAVGIAKETAGTTATQLGEIHDLVNDRLEVALQEIRDLRAQLEARG